MNWTTERLQLDLESPFTIARGTTETVEPVVVRLAHEGTVGVGAAAPSTRYGETPDTVAAVLPDLFGAARSVGDPRLTAAVERATREAVRRNPAARAAVSVAVHDWAARAAGVPLYERWGLDPAAAPRSSYSIGIDDPERMGARAGAAVDRGHELLKVKLDGGLAGVAAVREAAPDARIRVDANEAWSPREAVERCRALAEHDVEFVEQPVPAGDRSGLELVAERSPVPVAVDESVTGPADVPAVADRADVVVLKLQKCGGIGPTRRAIETARAHGLSVMLGCMVEPGASIAAAAHLSPAVDHVDLDGSLLLAADPFDGPVGEDGRIDLSDRSGTGVVDPAVSDAVAGGADGLDGAASPDDGSGDG